MTKDKRVGLLAFAFHVSQLRSGSPIIGVHHVKLGATQIHRGFMFHGLSLGLYAVGQPFDNCFRASWFPFRDKLLNKSVITSRFALSCNKVVRDAINRLNRTAVSSSHLTKLSKKAGWEVPLLSPATPKKA